MGDLCWGRKIKEVKLKDLTLDGHFCLIWPAFGQPGIQHRHRKKLAQAMHETDTLIVENHK